MIREIVTGERLFVKAKRAARKDIQVANDLEETLNAHRDKCVGMAANMIGENLALDIVETFLNTDFSGEERHRRRIDLIEKL